MNANFKSPVALAVAAVLGTGSAYALTPSSNPTPQHTIYLGGGSAEPQPITAAACSLLTNVDNFTDASGTNAGNQSGDYLVLYGAANATLAAAGGGNIKSGDSVLVIYKFNGGSYINGAVPQTSGGGSLTYPANTVILGSTAKSTGVTAGTACSTANNGAPTFSYSASTTVTAQPAFGVTDIEATAFTSPVNIPSTVTPVSVGNPDAVYDLVEGVAVTAGLFAKKTNFSSAEVKAILDGQISDWSQISGDNGSPLPAGGIVLLDRNIGSGTKAVGTEFFLGYPGLLNAGIAKEPQSYTGLVVNGDLGLCTVDGNNCYTGTSVNTTITTYQDISESSSATVVADLKASQAAGLLAIAVLSADNAPYLNQVGGVNTYDFVKINNTAMDSANGTDDINSTNSTSYKNVINGSYPFFYQVAFNTRSSTQPNTDAGDFTTAMRASLTSTQVAGVITGSHFPVSAPGIVLDGDDTACSKGVTLFTRGGNSQLPLSLHLLGCTITLGADPL